MLIESLETPVNTSIAFGSGKKENSGDTANPLTSDSVGAVGYQTLRKEFDMHRLMQQVVREQSEEVRSLRQQVYELEETKAYLKEMYKDIDREVLQQDDEIRSLRRQVCEHEETIIKLNQEGEELMKWPRIADEYKTERNYLKQNGLKQEEEIKSLREQVCDYQEIVATLNEKSH